MRIVGVLIALLVVLAGCTAPIERPAATGTTPDTPDADTLATPQTPPPDDFADPKTDVLGWENGYWYNESIDVTQQDGLNQSEIRLVVARSMARVERVRNLEFQKTVPVTVISREKFRKRQGDQKVPDSIRRFDNLKFEALFMINETTDSLAVQNQNMGSSVQGFYSPAEDSIVIISETKTPHIDEFTLAHELTHALQDQHFNLSAINSFTREDRNAHNGLIEGDANYVQNLYERRCGDAGWSCLTPESKSGGGGGLANVGVFILKFQPYSDGPAFVKELRGRGGWAAVNAAYDDLPASTEQIIHPEKYPGDQPTNVTVTDRTNESWHRLAIERQPDYGELGEAGMFSMLMYPAFETEGQTQLIPARAFFNRNEQGKVDSLDPYNYSHPYTAGWDGDQFVVYVNDRGKAGYVWKSAWDSKADASEFVSGYTKLLQFHGAKPVDGVPNTWRISAEEEFTGVYHIERRGSTVVIVRAPSVDQLSAVRAGTASGS